MLKSKEFKSKRYWHYNGYTMIDLYHKDKQTFDNLQKDNKIKNVYIKIEYEDNILDNIEKRYLKNIIRPFINDVKSIKKIQSSFLETYKIAIEMKHFQYIILPEFDKNSNMYKGMELNHSYTLKELELI